MALGRKDKKAEKETQHTTGTQRKDRPVITVDYEEYAHFLESADLTEDQKRDFIQTLWNIVVEFVSMGFGVHPVQQAQDACGQNEEKAKNPPILGPDDVILKTDILNKNFNNAVGSETDAAAEGVEK